MYVYLFYNNVQVQEEIYIYDRDRLNFRKHAPPKMKLTKYVVRFSKASILMFQKKLFEKEKFGSAIPSRLKCETPWSCLHYK